MLSMFDILVDNPSAWYQRPLILLLLETKTIKWYYLLLLLPKGPAFDKMYYLNAYLLLFQ
jgi:hypothetical protein